jgi:hypothetical protein
MKAAALNHDHCGLRGDGGAREDAFTEHGLSVRCDLLKTDYDKLEVQVRDATRGHGVIQRQ